MQISLKFIRGLNHAKSTTCMKFQLPVTFSSLFTGSSILPVFALSVLYIVQCSAYAHFLPHTLFADIRDNISLLDARVHLPLCDGHFGRGQGLFESRKQENC